MVVAHRGAGKEKHMVWGVEGGVSWGEMHILSHFTRFYPVLPLSLTSNMPFVFILAELNPSLQE